MSTKIFEVTININGKISKERFADRESLNEWLKITNYSPLKIEEMVDKSLFATLKTYEAKYFPSKNGELKRGKKLGLTAGTWVPDNE